MFPAVFGRVIARLLMLNAAAVCVWYAYRGYPAPDYIWPGLSLFSAAGLLYLNRRGTGED